MRIAPILNIGYQLIQNPYSFSDENVKGQETLYNAIEHYKPQNYVQPENWHPWLLMAVKILIQALEERNKNYLRKM